MLKSELAIPPNHSHVHPLLVISPHLQIFALTVT